MKDDKRQETLPSLPPRADGKRFRRWILLLIVFVALPFAPHVLALRLPRPPSGAADAVIVLSGGAGRIPEGYRLWKAGAGRDLCILGAGGSSGPRRFLPPGAALSPEELSRIRVEGWSENTLENAFSAKTIVKEKGYASVILVTSDYHAPRAYLAFRKVLAPEVAISVIPVRSESGAVAGAAWRWAKRHYIEGWKYWGYRILLRWE
jgi:uncharacterized SAM-binding protein YcdF (DUF218 family)